MAKDEKFMFFETFMKAIDTLPEDKRAEACYRFCRYGIYGELPEDEGLKMFCIGVSCSVQKYHGSGGSREGAGRPRKEKQKNQINQKNQKIQIVQTETETETETEITKIKKIKINDPYQNEFIKHYEDCYKKIIGCNNCFLLQMHRDKLNELAEELGDKYFKSVETVLKRLKKLNFEKLGIKPNTTWLLKNDNFIKVLEGTFTEDKEYNPYNTEGYNAFA